MVDFRGMEPALKVVNLEAPIWRIEEIASYLRISSVRGTYPIVRQPGFPLPIVHGSRNRRWIAEEVKAYFSTGKTARTEPIAPLRLIEPKVVAKKKANYYA